MPVHGHITEKQYLILKSRIYVRLIQFFSRFRGEVFLMEINVHIIVLDYPQSTVLLKRNSHAGGAKS